jgi:anaerobic selenocysteine-containing dehydrogenase
VRPFQDVLIELGWRLQLPGLTNADGARKYPGGYPDYLANHERTPGIGPLAVWRGNGSSHGKGAANPAQLDAYIANGCFWRDEIAPQARYFKHANKDYLEYATRMGFIGRPDPVVLQLYSEPLRKFQLAAEGHGPIQPPDAHRERVRRYFDPLPVWYAPFEGSLIDTAQFPLHAVTQRPAAMYHAWGSQNAWLRQIHGANRLHMNRKTASELGLADDDWVWVTSHHGRIKAQLRLMEGVNDRTVWTWNAIGKRAGAWNLALDAPESARGFLLNHLIAELLPDRGGPRYANSDPVTGQAAWYDLRVRIEKADPSEAGRSAPQLPPLKPPSSLAPPPEVLRYGAGFRRVR